MIRQALPELVHRALVRRAAVGVSDIELLNRFNTRRDADAFTELVERYAPLVWGVCRRVLHDSHIAEDALQATFITLAQGGFTPWAGAIAGLALWSCAENGVATSRPHANHEWTARSTIPFSFAARSSERTGIDRVH